MRRLLWIIAILFFAAGIITEQFFPAGKTKLKNSGENQAETVVYTVSKDPIFGGDTERFVAHRGYSNGAPENSVPAFELAGKCGFWGIETDISETNDGVFMCMHDDTIDRTTNGTGEIGDYTYAELMELSIDSGSNISQHEDLKIPTMIEYLNTCVIYNCVPVIEIKKIRDFDAFLETIYNSGLRKRCIVTGGIEDLEKVRSRDAQIPLMVIGYSNREYGYYLDLISRFDNSRGILYNYPVVTEDVVSTLHGQGIYCGVWSLDTAEEAERFMSYGVDYVVTNEIPGLNQMINDKE